MQDFDKKQEFFNFAISDLQQTIKFIDTKASAVIVIAVAFITGITSVLNNIIAFYNSLPTPTKLIVSIGALCFSVQLLISIILAIKTINPRTKPGEHIDDFRSKPKFQFFINSKKDENLLRLLFTDKDKTRMDISADNIYSFYKNCSEDDIARVTISEFLKLSYIRSIKTERVKFSLRFIENCFWTAILTLLISLLSVDFSSMFLLQKLPLTNIHLLILLILGHFVADFLFQTNYQAENKKNKIVPLIIHSLIYAITIVGLIIVFIQQIQFIYLGAFICLFISHFIIDKGYLTNFWIKYIKKAPLNNQCITFWVDQTFHMVILAAVYYLLHNI